jgi:hypothetical protein
MSESESGPDGRSVAQGELRSVVEAVRRYGENHPGIVEQIWFEHSPQRVVALLAGDDVQTHEMALRALVALPEYLEVRRSPWPQGHLERIREEIMESARGSISGLGLGKGILGVRLWADHMDVAASLHLRYGDAIDLRVGYFHYPDIDSGKSENLASVAEPPDLAALPQEISLSLKEGTEFRSGSHVRSQLTMRNQSTLELVAGKLIPPIVDPTNGRVAGGYEGAVTMEMRRYQVPAGATKEVPILIGTASTRPELGYAVPPGPWAIRIHLQLGAREFQSIVPIEVVW